MRVDQAIRQDRPLPRQRMPLILAITISTAIALTFVLIIIS